MNVINQVIFYLAATVAPIFLSVQADGQQILIDGKFDDWDDSMVIVNEANDVSASQIDIEKISAWNDNQYLYLKFDLDRDIDIQDDHRFMLSIDTDNNPSTGNSGFDFFFDFEERDAIIVKNGTSFYPSNPETGMMIWPTVTGSSFELCIKTEILSNQTQLFFSDQIRIALRNIGGDSTDPVLYQLNSNTTFTPAIYSIEKKEHVDIRIVSYNVKTDGLFEQETAENQKRLLKATQPDIIAFQEIYQHSTNEVVGLVEALFPQDNWEAKSFFSDVIVVSKYPVIETNSIDGNEITLLDVDGKPLVIINVHLPCCDNDEERQEEVDHILAVIRDKSTSNKITFEFNEETPFLILGDFNFVGEYQNIVSMLNGDIVSNNTYGPDFSPDPGGLGLRFANGLSTGLPGNSTWYSFASYLPGKLDFCFYPPSLLRLENSYVLNTFGLDNATLFNLDLEQSTSFSASDHFPLVSDFSFEPSVAVSNIVRHSFQIYPTILNEEDLTITVNAIQDVSATISNCAGKIVKQFSIDDIETTFDVAPLPSGIYYLTITQANLGRSTKAFVIQ